MPRLTFGDFEWDEAKATANLRKHDVAFEEAATVFLDPLSLPLQDVVHSDRMHLIGMSQMQRLLLVVFTERDDSGIIRIISARRATRLERRAYEEAS